MVTIAGFHRKLHGYYDCDGRDAIREYTESFKDCKAALTDLSSMFNLVIKDCEKAIKAVQGSKRRLAASAASGKEDGRSAGAGKKARVGARLIDLVVTAGAPAIPVVRAELETEAASGVDLGRPAIVSLHPLHSLRRPFDETRLFAEALYRDMSAARARNPQKGLCTRVSRPTKAGTPVRIDAEGVPCLVAKVATVPQVEVEVAGLEKAAKAL